MKTLSAASEIIQDIKYRWDTIINIKLKKGANDVISIKGSEIKPPALISAIDVVSIDFTLIE